MERLLYFINKFVNVCILKKQYLSQERWLNLYQSQRFQLYLLQKTKGSYVVCMLNM